MLDFMERNAIKVLFKKGHTKKEIAQLVGCSRKTVARVLDQPSQTAYHRRDMASNVDPYKDLIRQCLQKRVPVKRMIELARNLEDAPYTGGKTVFYDEVKKIRKELKQEELKALVTFDSLPGEYLQVDWGETTIKFATGARKLYFLCCRLKYSRFMFVEFHENMRFETLMRALIRCFLRLGGIPWQLVFDNMKTVTTGRDAQNKPILNERLKRFASEFDFAPLLCAPRAGNQKGSVENLVKFVKSNFLPARTFHDDQDLARELALWLERVNRSKSQAHQKIPANLLEEEQLKFEPLPEFAGDYGFVKLLNVNAESLVQFQSNRYSVPVDYCGQTLTVRIHESKIRIYDKDKLVAEHERCFDKNKRLRLAKHYKAVFKSKPRAEVMLLREKLLDLSPNSYTLVEAICRRHKAQFGPEILKLWNLMERHGQEDFLIAVDMAVEGQLFSSEYIEAFLSVPGERKYLKSLELPKDVSQDNVDRDLNSYDRYVMGGEE